MRSTTRPSIEMDIISSGMTHEHTGWTALCGSTGVTSESDIGYGGVDTEGVHDPASRRHNTVWDDDEYKDFWRC